MLSPSLPACSRAPGRRYPGKPALIALSGFVIEHGWLLLVGAIAGLLRWPRHAITRAGRKAALRCGPAAPAHPRRRAAQDHPGPLHRPVRHDVRLRHHRHRRPQVCRGRGGQPALRQGLQQVGQHIAQGSKVSDAFRSVELFPPLVTRMLRVGESTGALDTALANVSYFYDRDVREAIERLQASIEPTLTLLLGGLLLAVMGAVMMPVYDIVTRMKF
jgi:type II secretory pathway component PulF